MSQAPIGNPETSEYPAHFNGYVSLVPENDVVGVLELQHHATLTLLRSIDEPQANYRYAADKWSIKELVGHIIDAERAFSFRAFHFARNHKTPLPGFEQDSVAVVAPYGALALREISDEYDCVRRSTLHLFRHFDAPAWSCRGTANNSEITVRALAYVTAGHERHHLQILNSRYLQLS
jgi:DinB superfamily